MVGLQDLGKALNASVLSQCPNVLFEHRQRFTVGSLIGPLNRGHCFALLSTIAIELRQGNVGSKLLWVAFDALLEGADGLFLFTHRLHCFGQRHAEVGNLRVQLDEIAERFLGLAIRFISKSESPSVKDKIFLRF